MTDTTDETIKRQAAEQAPPPAFMKDVLKTVAETPDIEPGENRDNIMAKFSESDAWNIIKKYIEAKQMSLAAGLRNNVDKASMEEIGFRFMVTDQVNKFASELVNFVEAPARVKRAQHERESESV